MKFARLVVCLLTCAACLPVFGQEVTAAITGQVMDQTGAAVAGAAVTAKDMERGTVYSTVSNTDGIYNLPRLPIGTYEVRVESKGFQTAVRSSIALQLNQTARVDFTMNVGQVNETVQVTGAAPILQTENTQVGTVINSTTNVSLPLATRNYVQLTLLAPGSTNPNPSSMTGAQTTGSSGRPYINGNREQANNFLLDGVDNNQVSDNLVGYTPSVDAIQEFNMITNNASAEFGNFQGGIISTYIKSGTNEFHGDLFEFFRNDKLNANTWGNNWQGVPKETLRWNMFGGTIGGPIKKDKLFFFADYQGQRFNHPTSVSTVSLLTPAERTGDFSQLLAQKGIQLYNPFQVDAAGNRAPFPNNQIPLTLIDPVARNLFASGNYPTPTLPGLENNYYVGGSNQTHGDQGDIKIDANITEKDRLMGRYSQSRQSSPSFTTFALNNGSFFEAPTKNGVATWTRTISPRFVNELRGGVNYVLVNNGGTPNNLGNFAEQIGIAQGNQRGPGLFGINFNSGVASGFGEMNVGTQQLFANTVIQVTDAAVITIGRHTLHSGFSMRRNRINTFYAGNNGRTGFMTFDGRFTAGPNARSVAGSGTGAGEADFFLGLPADLGRGVNSGTWGQRNFVLSAYTQDDWHVTNNFTLNLGLRYEVNTPWVEVDNRQANFAPFSGDPQLAGTQTIYNNNRALYNSYNLGYDFQPRFGLAWTPGFWNSRFVIRGAYTTSTYLEGTGTNLRLPLNPPFNQEYEARYDNFIVPPTRTEQGLSVLTSNPDPYAGANIRLWDPYIRPALSQQYNFTVQTRIDNNTTLQAGYVGQTGTHLMVPMPFFQRQLLPDGTTAPSPFLSGNPALASISQISGTESNGSMQYDSLQAVLDHRYAAGLQFQISYTYSKCMSNSIGYYGNGGQAAPQSAYWQDLYNMNAEWGPCFYDVTHMLTPYAVWDIPFGKTRKFGKNMNPVLNGVIGDWNLSAIVQIHTGYPQTIRSSDASGTNSRGARASCIAPGDVLGRQPSPAGGYQWFSPAPYVAPTPGTFGTCGVGTIRGPGMSTLDLGVMKRIPVTESQSLEIRGEFINLFNTPVLNSPIRSLGGDLGRITGSQLPRNIQIAMKYYF